MLVVPRLGRSALETWSSCSRSGGSATASSTDGAGKKVMLRSRSFDSLCLSMLAFQSQINGVKACI